MAAPERRGASAIRAERLVPGADYYLDEQGRTVFTAHYNRRRGFCCYLACRHCPWGQAGRTPAEAQQDLRQRLDALQQRLAQAGLPARVLGYRNGELTVRSLGAARVAAGEADVRAQAEGLLTVVALVWS